ncbi:hypothetical protein GGR24_002584 [Hansschlegelia beijingensis]|uniref:Glycosyltransferase 2-like domain-containing protein n=2 Tax=Hansschlegelia beijingensis TaxID=1133344 RepID=A0A7W6GGD3_9HYPH|nr:hypothetical protein [Hansschlegelia beijingensis]
MLEVLIFVGLALAALPAGMTAWNLWLLSAPPLPASHPSVAILIPARDEEETIGPCVEAALGSVAAEIRVIVADDGSTDRTAEIVGAIAARDPRVELFSPPALPPGWNGKQHACQRLAERADAPFLLFVDADVRLSPEAAARLAGRLESGGFALVSGVPRQIVETVWERLLIPMINALLLGYLPVSVMRRLTAPSLGAGCGQLMMARRDAYLRAGGHASIRTSMHDGLKLPRAFRRAGFMTDLVDGTPLASCRMYRSKAEVWAGFTKNATEGMATPVGLPIWTVLLFGGHIMPWLLLPFALEAGVSAPAAAAACALPIAARLLQAWRCREPFWDVALHPLSIAATLVLQWRALLRHRRGATASWRGRDYQTSN